MLLFRKSYLALDIGNKNMKMVWGGTEKDKIHIYEYGIVNSPADSIKDGRIINPAAIARVVKEFIKKHKIKTDKMIANITGTGVITRDIQLPKSTDEEIEKMLEYEARQYFPVDLGNYVLDYKVQEEVMNPEGVFNRLILAAVPVKQADEYMEIPHLLDMEMKAMDLPANSISKSLFGFGAGRNRADENYQVREFAVLDIGSDTTGVYIFYDGRLKFNRILLNGSSDVDRLISKEFNVALKQAEEIKRLKAKVFSEEDEVKELPELVQLCRAIRPAVNNIITDISRFFDFYNSRNTGNKIETIYICGGGSKLKGLDAYIGSYFNISAERISSPDSVVYKGNRRQEEFKEDFACLVSAIGAVVRYN